MVHGNTISNFRNSRRSERKFKPYALQARDRIQDFGLSPVSGRYEGSMVFPIGGKTLLELRIDIDEIQDNSPVLKRISGDFYQTHLRSSIDEDLASSTSQSNIYLGSWIVDNPFISSSTPAKIEIVGHVRYWNNNHPETTIEVVAYHLANNATRQVEITLTDVLGNTTKYLCIKKSQYLREIELEIDMTKSVERNPVLPIYDTHWNTNHPLDLSRRTLTVQECYREAGINISTSYIGNVIDDSDASFIHWDDDELYDAMATYYSQNSNNLPAWKMWGLLCGKYAKDNVLGIMFDADLRYGNQRNKPQRRGFAIFKNNSAFADLRLQTVPNEEQAYALRQYLRTFVHEVGHTFNLVHPWKKDKPSSLSWMNYPRNYPYGPHDPRNNENEYWNNFRFRFDDEELIHLRHGARAEVIMGGNLWSLGSQTMEMYSFPIVFENGSPIEFLLRSKDYFDYMEPIEIELRLKNLVNLHVDVDTLVNPEFGRVKIFIANPNGSVGEFVPLLNKESEPIVMTLSPMNSNLEGADRYSEDIVITYGKDGFYFSNPGEYQIQAIYQGFENIVIPSNVLRIRVKPPMSSEEDSMAYDFFTYQVGMNLYLKGSQSSFLSEGRKSLEAALNLGKVNSMNSTIAYILASAEIKPFFKISGKKLVQTHKPSPERVIEITEQAKHFYVKAKQKSYNIPYRNLAQTRAGAFRKLNKADDAREELMDLYNNLIGANMTVLKGIDNQAKGIFDKLR